MIVVTDLEQLKAYRLEHDPLHSSPRLELIEQFNTGAARKLVDETTDLAGRFPRATVAPDMMGGMSQGERHNAELEKRKRCTRRLAGEINSLLERPDVERCFLAASREISNSLMNELNPRLRNKIEITIPADLTKVKKADLPRHFRAASRTGALA
ncbi:MAG TPA: host attachment protein [Candidatus Paceibacterota bacterium]|nr:host attachment protein [Candidatus Paceibacterota bacterium]